MTDDIDERLDRLEAEVAQMRADLGRLREEVMRLLRAAS